MSRRLVYLILALFVFLPGTLSAFDDGPTIDIHSPDFGTTYSQATIKNHSLVWRAKDKMLVAVVTFVESHDSTSSSNPDDTHYFTLPGISLDEAKGVFSATSANGEVIPVAQYKKTLFIKSIVIMPNANVRIRYPRGDISVELVALSPNDPALHPSKGTKKDGDDSDTDSEGNHQIPLNKLFQ